jgi:hypothetical protein
VATVHELCRGEVRRERSSGIDEGLAMVASPRETYLIDVLRAAEARWRKMIEDAGIKVE